MKKKITISAGVLVILLVSFYIWQRTAPTAPSPQFIIGAVLPLTGEQGSLGQEVDRGASLAIDAARQKGVSAIYMSQDDQLDPTMSVNAANQLLQVEDADALLMLNVQEAKPTISLAAAAQIPLLVTWDSNDFLKSGGPYAFSIGFSTEGAGRKMAEHAYGLLHLRKVAVISQLDEWSSLISKAFAARFEELGGQVVSSDETSDSQKDFRSIIAKAQSHRPDGIYFPLVSPPEISIFLIQASQLGVSAKLMTGDGFTQDNITEAKTAAEGVYYTQIYADNTASLVRAYVAKYHEQPPYPEFASFGYDGVTVLLEAHRIAQENDLSLRDALMKVKISGTGTNIDMNGTQFSERQEKLYQVVNGKMELAE